jgi:hypothetical protein
MERSRPFTFEARRKEMKKTVFVMLLVLGFAFPGFAAEVTEEVDESTGTKYTSIRPCYILKKYEWWYIEMNPLKVSNSQETLYAFQVIHINRRPLFFKEDSSLIVKIEDKLRGFSAVFTDRGQDVEVAIYQCTLDDMKEIVNACDQGKSIKAEVVGRKKSMFGELSGQAVVNYKKFLNRVDPDSHYDLSKKKSN